MKTQIFRSAMRVLLSIIIVASHSPIYAGGTDGQSGQSSGEAAPVKENAEDGEDQSNTAMGVNAGLGVVFAVIAYICYDAQQYGCAAAMTAASVMSFAQAALQGSAAGDYGETAAATGFGGEVPTTGSTSGGKMNFDDAVKDAAKNNPDFAKLTSKGFKFNPTTNTVTLPDGTEMPVDPKAFSSLDALANSAGLSGDLRAQMMADAQKVIDGAKKSDEGAGANVVSMDVNSAGGGGGGGAAPVRGNSALDSLLGDLKKKGTGAANTAFAGTVSGLSKNFMGEPIGLAGDNLFLMVHRRYQKKRSTNEFIEVEPNYRRPASAPVVSDVPDYLK